MQGIDMLVVIGIIIECCVELIVCDVFYYDYQVLVVSDVCVVYEEDFYIVSLCVMVLSFVLFIDIQSVIVIWGI